MAETNFKCIAILIFAISMMSTLFGVYLYAKLIDRIDKHFLAIRTLLYRPSDPIVQNDDTVLVQDGPQ